jgi:hypothetical protein
MIEIESTMLIIDITITLRGGRIIESSTQTLRHFIAMLLFDKDCHHLFITSAHIYSDFTQSHEESFFIFQLQTLFIKIYEGQALHRVADIGIWLFPLSLLLECLRGYSLQVPQQRAAESFHQHLSCY